MMIHLIGSNAIPIDEDHYRVEVGYLQDRRTRAAQFTKKAVGETIDEIQRPNSEFMAYLAKIDPSKQYLLCMMNNDSFAIYREVRKLAASRGIKVGWDTIYRTDGVLIFVLGGGSGGRLHGPLEGR
jgi:hypothetical protein